MMSNCSLCGLPESLIEHCGTCRAIYSSPYRHEREYASGKAYRAVAKAVRAGELPALGIRCVDCGEPATDWEHRDYDAALKVDPVCRRCNIARGEERSYPIRNSWAAREKERAGG